MEETIIKGSAGIAPVHAAGLAGSKSPFGNLSGMLDFSGLLQAFASPDRNESVPPPETRPDTDLMAETDEPVTRDAPFQAGEDEDRPQTPARASKAATPANPLMPVTRTEMAGLEDGTALSGDAVLALDIEAETAESVPVESHAEWDDVPEDRPPEICDNHPLNLLAGQQADVSPKIAALQKAMLKAETLSAASAAAAAPITAGPVTALPMPNDDADSDKGDIAATHGAITVPTASLTEAAASPVVKPVLNSMPPKPESAGQDHVAVATAMERQPAMQEADFPVDAAAQTRALAAQTPANDAVSPTVPAPPQGITPVGIATIILPPQARPVDSAVARSLDNGLNGTEVLGGHARHLSHYQGVTQLTAARSARAAALQAGSVVEQVTVKLHQQAKSGLDDMTIQLRPADLGRIDIKLHFHDGSVTGTIVADNQTTLDMLVKDQRGLERALQESGLRTEQGALSFELRDQSGQGHYAQPEGRGAARSLAFTAAAEETGAAAMGSDELITENRVNLRV